ncbi:MAG TPA: YrrS family protein [Sporolactobacillaceae bacterium]|nr:YrrS family protein [Sporolactobacillaceae bacterium]
MSLPNPNTPSRSSRNKSNRMNSVLNWSIGIVVVAIICVGGYLLFAIFHHPANQASSNAGPKKPTTTTVDGSIGNATSSSKDKKVSNSSDQSSSNSSKASDSSNSGSTSTDTSNTNDAYHFVGGGPNGPWQPIGTVQKGPHTTDYNKGSVDWNERIKALLYATNINDGDYTLWRLENGGGPDKSRGIISTKEDPSKKYDVLLQWVKNKGWKPVSVTLDSGGK